MQGLVLAATPIGNTGDASARLIQYLQEADVVAAEDTRRLYDLARRLGIHIAGHVVSYHDHNERDKADALISTVQQGKSVLVVSDAGMPMINDPGHFLVRRAIEEGLPITCAPGPSAVLDALVLSGLPTDRFCYEGFLPRKTSERQRAIRSLTQERRTIVWYETKHRIVEAMQDLVAIFGADRRAALCRELTKEFEQVRRGTLGELSQSVLDDPPMGEIVLVVAGFSGESSSDKSETELAQLAIAYAKEHAVRLKDATTAIVQQYPLADGTFANRKAVYAAALQCDHL